MKYLKTNLQHVSHFSRELVVAFMAGLLILFEAWCATWAFTTSLNATFSVESVGLLVLGVAVTISAAFFVTLPTALSATPRRVRTAIVAGYGAVFLPLFSLYFGPVAAPTLVVLVFWAVVTLLVATFAGRRKHFTPRSLKRALKPSASQSELLEHQFRSKAISDVYLVSLFVAAVLGVGAVSTGFRLAGLEAALGAGAAIAIYMCVLVVIWRSGTSRRETAAAETTASVAPAASTDSQAES